MKNNLYRLKLIAALFIIIIFAVNAYAGSTSSEKQSDCEFSDPKFIQPMSKEWIDKPIKYDKWAEHADLAVALDQHLYTDFAPLIEKYAKENKLFIKIREGTCGISGGAFANKTVDMAGLCCPPANFERLPGLKYNSMGIAAIAIIVHPDNPIDNITVEQARGLFSGTIKKWSELKDKNGKNGPDSEVHPITRLHCKTRPGHWRLILDNEDKFSLNAKEVATIPDMIRQVSEDKYSVGYETVWSTVRLIKSGKVKILSINGYNPAQGTAEFLKYNYPFYRVYNITSWEGKLEKNAHIKKMIDYLFINIENIDAKYKILPAKYLREAGWKFNGNELIGSK
jgi:ABC-type phosphate transport system substrate-binding protein